MLRFFGNGTKWNLFLKVLITDQGRLLCIIYKHGHENQCCCNTHQWWSIFEVLWQKVFCPLALRSNICTKSHLKICFRLPCFHRMLPCHKVLSITKDQEITRKDMKQFWNSVLDLLAYSKCPIKRNFWKTVTNTALTLDINPSWWWRARLCCKQRAFEWSPVLWTCKIQFAQHVVKEEKFLAAQEQKWKVRRQGPPGGLC